MSSNLFPQLTAEEEFILKWQYRLLGGFKTALIEAIMLADLGNLYLLSLGFPDEVSGYKKYANQEGWWQDVQEKANIIPLRGKEVT